MKKHDQAGPYGARRFAGWWRSPPWVHRSQVILRAHPGAAEPYLVDETGLCGAHRLAALRQAPRLYKQPGAASVELTAERLYIQPGVVLAELTEEKRPAMAHQMAAKSLNAVAVIQRSDETGVPVCGVERQ